MFAVYPPGFSPQVCWRSIERQREPLAGSWILAGFAEEESESAAVLGINAV